MNTYMTDGVGKKIVEALKKQSEIEINAQQAPKNEQEQLLQAEEPVSSAFEHSTLEQPIAESEVQSFENTFVQQPQPIFAKQMSNNMYSQIPSISSGISEFGDLEVPANVAVLKQLISQLPSGVSRQAGALVIKQTMEALGISMKTVLNEAQQLQETINLSARECQNNILECKKQINSLETQVHKYQKQSSSLNEIISLFVQLG